VAFAVLLASSIAAPAVASTARSERSLMGVPVMAGGVVDGDRIVYGGGAVVVVPAIIASFDSCPNGAVCLFADPNWGGALALFSSCCAWNNLSAYGLNNFASSWRNRLSVDAQIAKDAGGGGAKLCLNNNSYSSSMPSGWDNAASSIRIRNAATFC
jgi:hypothetical protein